MQTETPRQQIDRLNEEQRTIWDGQRTYDYREQRATRLHEINSELEQAWAAERAARASVSNPQAYGALPLVPRRHR